MIRALACVAATSAAATIVPQQAIRGVHLGMSKRAVVALLGKPARVRHGNGDFGRFTTFSYPGLLVSFGFDTEVTAVTATTAAERTAAGGVGVGSPESAVRARVAGARCLTESGYRHCYVGVWRAGRIVTDFAIRDGRVSRVLLGRVLD